VGCCRGEEIFCFHDKLNRELLSPSLSLPEFDSGGYQWLGANSEAERAAWMDALKLQVPIFFSLKDGMNLNE